MLLRRREHRGAICGTDTSCNCRCRAGCRGSWFLNRCGSVRLGRLCCCRCCGRAGRAVLLGPALLVGITRIPAGVEARVCWWGGARSQALEVLLQHTDLNLLAGIALELCGRRALGSGLRMLRLRAGDDTGSLIDSGRAGGRLIGRFSRRPRPLGLRRLVSVLCQSLSGSRTLRLVRLETCKSRGAGNSRGRVASFDTSTRDGTGLNYGGLWGWRRAPCCLCGRV